jgi:hypothetical protein
LPLCPVTALHLSGHCHCVSCGSRRWRDPRESCSHGRSMAPHSPRHCTVHPSFPGTLVGSRILALVPVPDPPTSPPFPVRCTATSAHQAINAPVLASPPSHPQIRSRARRITLLRQCSGGRGSGAVGKEVVGGRATRSSRCS